MLDRPRTPPATLRRAREIAMKNGIRYAYVGNVHDTAGDSTYCHVCGHLLIGRDWYELTAWNLTTDIRCPHCGTRPAGVFEPMAGAWGAQRMPIRLADYY
jgi:pyruvate formate lyase activating enzyme